MRKQYIKILTGLTCGLVPLVCPISSCSNQKLDESETESKLESITILNNFPTFIVEVNQVYDSEEIQIECRNKKKEIIESETKLELTNLGSNQLDISIIDNKIHIGLNKQKGLYKYSLIAKSIDESVCSEPKTINIYIYKESELKHPDEIYLIGEETKSMFLTDSTPIDYTLKAKYKGEELLEFDPECKLSVSIESSSTGKIADIVGNALFSINQNNKRISLFVSTNVDDKYVGYYKLKINASLASNPDVFTTKELELELKNGSLYFDSNTKFVYSRETLDSPWFLKTAPSTTTYLDSTNLLTSIYNKPVVGIGDDFCGMSGIKDMCDVEPPDSYIYIGDNAFKNQDAISVAKLSNLIYVGQNAFLDCTLMSAKSTIEYKFKFIGKGAFQNCQSFSIENLPDIVSLGDDCFKAALIKNIHLGPSLGWLGSNVFLDCNQLSNIYIKSTNPPTLLGDFLGSKASSEIKIHVIYSSLDTYKNDPNWTIYSDKLVGDLQKFSKNL